LNAQHPHFIQRIAILLFIEAKPGTAIPTSMLTFLSQFGDRMNRGFGYIVNLVNVGFNCDNSFAEEPQKARNPINLGWSLRTAHRSSRLLLPMSLWIASA
jgi:hypothetical protein